MSSAVGAVARWIAPFLTVAAVAGIGLAADPVQVGTAPAVRLASEANPLAGAALLRQSRVGGHARRAERRSAESRVGRHRQHAAGVLDGPGVYPRRGREVHRCRTGCRHHAGSGALWNPASRLRELRRGWVRRRPTPTAGGSTASHPPLASGPAAIILEPDALAMADCLSADQRQERFDLMRYAVDTLTRNPAAAVYIDAGHSRWLSAEDMAARLNDVGVGKARGFSLNTANFFTTEEEIGYGEAISGLTNGAHYVIDTSRNGAGPSDDRAVLVQSERPGTGCLRPPRPPRARTPTPTCGSNVPVNPTAHAAAVSPARGAS